MAKSLIGNIGGVGLPSNLYSGGAVVFNSEPYTNYYLNQVAHKRAQEDAMYRYFGEMGKGLTSTGMAANDIEPLMNMKNQWQNYMMQNRQAIARPGIDQGKAYMQANAMYNSMLDHINKSKAKVKNLSSLAPVLHSPQKAALLTGATQLAMHYGSLPVNDPHYKEFDPTSIQYDAAPFGNKQINDLSRTLSKYKPTEVGDPTIVNLNDREQQITRHYRFNENDLNGMYTQGATQYNTDASFQNMIDKVKEEPAIYHNLNQTFNEHYGRNIVSGEDAATAYLLTLHPDISHKTQIRTKPISPYESAAATLGREKQFYDYKQQQQAVQLDNAEKFLAGQEAEAKKAPPQRYFHAATDQWQNSYNTKFTPDQIKKIFSIRDVSGKHTLTPDRVQILDNGDYLPIFYEYDDKGNAVKGPTGNIAYDEKYTKPVSRDAVKASIVANKIVPKQHDTSAQPTKTVEKTKEKIKFGSGGLN